MSSPTPKNRIRATEKPQTTRPTQDSAGFVEVLYQRMGDRWYAFSLVDDEVFFSPVDQDLIDQNQDRFPTMKNGVDRKGTA